MNSVSVVREIEKFTKFWQLEAGNSLLSNREENEAYLASKAGETYVVFFTDGGVLNLELAEHESNFALRWFDIRNGNMVSQEEVRGGMAVQLSAPDQLEWIAVVTAM